MALAAAVCFVGINEWSYHNARASLDASQLSVNKRATLREVQRLMLEAESSQRGYLLTQQQSYRQPFLHADERVKRSLAKVQALYADDTNASHQADVHRLADLVDAKLSEMEQTLAYADEGRPDLALDLLQAGLGLTAMQQLDTILTRLVADEVGVTNRVFVSTTDVLVLQRIGIALLAVLSTMAVMLLYRLSARELAERERHRLELKAERDKLEADVQARTQDLTVLADHLQNVREDERAHLARELHDELGGLLTAAKLDVARIKSRLHNPEHAELVKERIVHLVQTLDAGIALKRRIIEDLRPSTLSNLGLTTALDVLCKDYAARTDASLHAAIEEVELPPKLQLTVFRLVQEALTNIGKYAEAGQVHVSLRADGDWAEVRIEDDGRGFDPSALVTGAHGLAGMRFRVAAHGGELTVHSQPGQGTQIVARLPQQDAPT